jgi:hypothetical protein
LELPDIYICVACKAKIDATIPKQVNAARAYRDGVGNAIEPCPHGVVLGWCYVCGDVNVAAGAVSAEAAP